MERKQQNCFSSRNKFIPVVKIVPYFEEKKFSREAYKIESKNHLKPTSQTNVNISVNIV